MTKAACFVLLAWPVAAQAAFGDLPLRFEENRGQADRAVQFLARGPGYSLALSSGRARFVTGGREVTLRLAGANSSARASGESPLGGISNYMLGTDRSQWRTRIPNYERVRFAAVYPGVDLVYYGKKGELEYDFIVQPGAKPERIAFSFEGAGRARVDPSGDLILSLANGEVRQKKPVIYQEAGGRRVEIAGRYRQVAGGRIGFAVDAYDKNLPLVIDPVLQFSTFFGGQIYEKASAIAVDSDGNIYVAGLSASPDFPRTLGAYQNRLVGGNDVFVAKLNPTGSTVLYATQVGGTDEEFGISMAVDRFGNALVAGSTRSINFPTTPGVVRERGAGGVIDGDGFVFKLGSTGSNLVYSTRIGGSGVDTVNAIALDVNGAPVLTGQTNSSNFPISSEDVIQPDRRGGDDAFVTKLNDNGTAYAFSTLLGGDSDSFIVGTEGGRAIAVDRVGTIYVAGFTTLRDFPRTPNAIQDTHLGQSDVFFTKIRSDGRQILYSTFLGGEGLDTVNAIYIEPSGTNVYLVGGTTSARYPTTPNAYQTFLNGGQPIARDGFISKINANGQLVYSTFLGGNGDDQLNGVVGDDAGNVYVIGTVSSTNMPTTVDAIQANISAGQGGEPYDAYIAYVNGNANKIIWSSYLGGPRNEEGNAIARDARGNLYVAGYSQSGGGFPLTANAFQGARGFGTNTAFIARIGEQRPPASQLVIISGDKQQGNQGTALPNPLVVELRDEFNVPISNQNVSFTATNATLSGSGGLTNAQGRVSVTVTLGDRPGAATVTATASNVPAAKFELTSLRVGPPLPEISLNGVVGAGLSNPPMRTLSTNTIATIFGSRLAPAGTNAQADSSTLVEGQVPTNLAGTCVVVDGIAARILAVTEAQINFIVPELTRTGMVPVYVLTNCGRVAELKSDPQQVEIAAASPEFFYSFINPGGRNFVSVVDAQTGQLLSTVHPRQLVSIYGTGFGVTNPPTGTGELPTGIARTVETPIVTYDGRPLDPANILYAGITPGLAGVYQLNLMIPLNARNGNIPIRVRFGLQSSPDGAFLRVEGGENRDPQVAVSPTRLDFGDVVIGQTRELPVTIANTGTSLLTVRAFDPGLPVFTLRPSFGFELDPGQTRVLTMTFTPTVPGPISANLRIATDDPVEPVLSVPLLATALVQPPPPNPVPVITSISPGTIDAGSAAFNLVVNGSNFVRGSLVEINGRARSTFFNHAAQLIAFIEALDITDAGTVNVVVRNPPPAGGPSNTVALTVRGAPATPQPLGLINQFDLRFCPAVSSFVTVLDSGGLPVRNLNRERLTCKEGDQIVDCTIAAAGAETPVAMHLLFGMNGIVNEAEQVQLKSATRQLIQTLGGQDKIAITHLEDVNRLQLDFTRDISRALGVIDLLRPVPPGNALYDSVVSTASSTRLQVGNRRIVVLITALDNLSGVLRDLNQALGTARSSGVTFYTVAIGPGKSNVALTGFLRTLARDTGGQFFSEDVPTNYSGLLGRIATIIQSQYEIRHQSPNFNGIARDLDFAFQIPEGTVHAVRTYSPCLP
jgi:uncharacterized protein (TIGR03437 family)